MTPTLDTVLNIVVRFTSLTHLLNNDNNTDTGDIKLIKHSPYFSETDFQRLQFGKGRLRIMSLNSQSINAKFDELRLFKNRINKVEEIGVVCLQETWTSENEDIRLFQLPNYKLFHKGKKCCNHGGLFMYVHERFDVEPLDLAFVCTKWEGHCVKISQTEPYIRLSNIWTQILTENGVFHISKPIPRLFELFPQHSCQVV